MSFQFTQSSGPSASLRIVMLPAGHRAHSISLPEGIPTGGITVVLPDAPQLADSIESGRSLVDLAIVRLDAGATLTLTACTQLCRAALAGALWVAVDNSAQEAALVALADSLGLQPFDPHRQDRLAGNAPGHALPLNTNARAERSNHFDAVLEWLDQRPGVIGEEFRLTLAGQETTAAISTLRSLLNCFDSPPLPDRLEQGHVATCSMTLSQELLIPDAVTLMSEGRFLLRDAATGDLLALGRIQRNLPRAKNIHRQALSVNRRDRERLNGATGKVIWLTGLSGSGKSTVANALEKALHDAGQMTYILDGDNVRHGLNRDLGFSDADRVENIRRVAEVAKLMLDAGLVVITAFISPFRGDREMARKLIGNDDFFEIHISTPLEICEQRDPKGLYRKARNGELPNLTGIGSPYETPVSPELKIDTSTCSLDESVQKILARIGSGLR